MTIAGLKHDVALLGRVPARPGDHVTVADVSMHTNRAPWNAYWRAASPSTISIIITRDIFRIIHSYTRTSMQPPTLAPA